MANTPSATESLRCALVEPFTLASWLGHEDLHLVDVRGLDFFLGYIPGSRRVPLELFSKDMGKIFDELGEEKATVVFVCRTGGGASRSAAREFSRASADIRPSCRCDVYYLEGGFLAWERQFASHREAARYIARAPSFPGAPYSGLVRQPPPTLERGGSARGCEAALGAGDFSRRTSCCSARDGSGEDADDLSGDFFSRQSTAIPEGESAQELAEVEEPQGDPLRATSREREAGEPNVKFGDGVWVCSRSLGNKWKHAVVTGITEDTLKVQYFLNGRCCIKVLPRGSPDLSLTQPEEGREGKAARADGALQGLAERLQRQAQPGASASPPPTLAGPAALQQGGRGQQEDSPGGSQSRRSSLAAEVRCGDLLWVRSRSAGNVWVEAVVTAEKCGEVRVQYSRRGKCCLKSLPLDSPDISLVRPASYGEPPARA